MRIRPSESPHRRERNNSSFVATFPRHEGQFTSVVRPIPLTLQLFSLMPFHKPAWPPHSDIMLDFHPRFQPHAQNTDRQVSSPKPTQYPSQRGHSLPTHPLFARPTLLRSTFGAISLRLFLQSLLVPASRSCPECLSDRTRLDHRVGGQWFSRLAFPHFVFPVIE